MHEGLAGWWSRLPKSSALHVRATRRGISQNNRKVGIANLRLVFDDFNLTTLYNPFSNSATSPHKKTSIFFLKNMSTPTDLKIFASFKDRDLNPGICRVTKIDFENKTVDLQSVSCPGLRYPIRGFQELHFWEERKESLSDNAPPPTPQNL
jgi:hypothetical protein